MSEGQPPGAEDVPLLTVSYDLVTPYASRGGLLLPIVQAAIEFSSGEFQSVLALIDTARSRLRSHSPIRAWDWR